MKEQQEKVVNVKVEYIRPKYNNLKEWEADPNNVYIGRKEISQIGFKMVQPIQDRLTYIKIAYIFDKIDKHELDITELFGKTLGCWCKPEACHGDVLLRLIELEKKKFDVK